MTSTGPVPKVRDQVKRRANGRCERCGIILNRPPHIHHRQPRKAGGSTRPWINLPGNLLHLCSFCHNQVERERGNSYTFGWLVREPTLPSGRQVKLWDGWYYLTDDGERVSATVPGVARGL